MAGGCGEGNGGSRIEPSNKECGANKASFCFWALSISGVLYQRGEIFLFRSTRDFPISGDGSSARPPGMQSDEIKRRRLLHAKSQAPPAGDSTFLSIISRARRVTVSPMLPIFFDPQFLPSQDLYGRPDIETGFGSENQISSSQLARPEPSP